MTPRRLLAPLAALWLLAAGGSAAAEESVWDALQFAGFVAGEVRSFPTGPQHSGQKSARVSPSVFAEPDVRYEWNDGRDRLRAIPFARLDADDENRTHADLRELSWYHSGTGWDMVLGVSRVFWGVTESRHLVDIVNQTDLVEDIDTEDKLGQPMANVNFYAGGLGTLSLFALPVFREQTFPADDARLRGALRIRESDAKIEGGHLTPDFAVRWAGTTGDFDYGIAHFHGIGREPRLVVTLGPGGRPEFVPHYDVIDQTSFDGQYTRGGLLLKIEAITRGGQGKRFVAAVGGFEYTFFGVFGGRADVGILGEYLYDGRDPDPAKAPPTPFDNDVFFGVRLSLNDVQGTRALAGMTVDHDTGAMFLSLEAERRLNAFWSTRLEARSFANVPRSDFFNGIRDDDYVSLSVFRYF